MKQLKLSIIVVNYNTKNFLDRCVQSILENSISQKKYEIIVVDNASEDQTVQVLSKKYAQINWIALKENLGFAKANNIGIRKSSKSDYIFFLNPDTILEVKALEKLLFYANQNLQVGIVSPFVKLPSGVIDDACHRGFPTPWNALMHFTGLGKVFPSSTFFNGYHLGYRGLDRIHEIDACAGAAMLVRYKCGEEIGWWDQDFFWYGEDLDFCYRAQKAGWKIIFYPHTKVLHYKGVSGGIKKESKDLTRADSKVRKRAQKARFAAMRIFYQKHYAAKYPRLVKWGVLRGISFFERLLTRDK